MIGLYIILGLIVLFLVLIIISFFIHSITFGKRYEANPLIRLYTKEEFNLKSTPLEIKYKNERIRGNLYNYDNYDTNKLIVFCHGMLSDQNSYLQDIEYFCRNNYQVFGFDYIGVSSSTGKNIKGLGNSLKSLDIVISYLKLNYPNKDIYVVGHSWGGYATTNIVSLHPDILGIVAMAPFISTYSCLMNFIPKGLRFLAPFIYFIDYLKNGKYTTYKTKDSLKNYKGKVMLLASKDDPMINYDKNTGYIKHIYPNFSYLIFDKKGHNPNYTNEAVIKLKDFQNSIKTISKNKMVDYMNSINFHELGELDSNVMDKIIDFIK